MPEINHPSSQAAFRPVVSNCVAPFVHVPFPPFKSACLLASWVPIPSAICKQHGRLTRCTDVTACSACIACAAHDSSQCMPEINHPSSQAANRPKFTHCVPAIDSSFCDASCLATCHEHRDACMTHRFRISRRPAYSGPRLHSSPRSPLRRRPQIHGTHRCCSFAHFCIVPARPLAFC